jgi:hypothetical protein
VGVGGSVALGNTTSELRGRGEGVELGGHCEVVSGNGLSCAGDYSSKCRDYI